MIAPRPTPVRVTIAGATKLPRWALWALLLAFILPGLTGREPWQEDAGGFGLIWTMATGVARDWLLPNVAGASLPEEGPLAFWLGAIAVRLAGPWLGAPLASRIICILAFAISIASLWHATLRLARLDEAQPVSLAFGGEAEPRDYGRMMADIAILLIVATLGLVNRVHETTAETIALPAACLCIYGLALSIEQRLRGAVVIGLALGLLALARGPMAACGLLAGCALAWLWDDLRTRRFVASGGVAEAPPDAYVDAPQHRQASRPHALVAIALAVAVTLLVFGAWPVAAWLNAPTAAGNWFDEWRRWVSGGISPIGLADLGWIGRNASWQLWPLWPLAACGLYAFRHDLGAPHVALPALAGAGVLAAAAFSAPLNDGTLIPLIPALVVVGAYGASTMRRALENVIDWFSLMVFSLFLLFVWAYWAATMLGAPRAMAASVARLTPGMAWQFTWPAFLVAAAATGGWLALSWWRIVRRPAPLWRGPLFAASGLVALWIVLVALFLPGVDYNRSHSALARDIAAQVRVLVPAGSCVQAHRIPPAYRALIAYFGPLRFGRDDSPEACPIALQRDTARSRLDDDPPPGDERAWRLAWQTSRAGRPDEIWRLWLRTGL